MTKQETISTPLREATRNQLRWFAREMEMSPYQALLRALSVAEYLESGGLIPLCTYERFQALVEEIESALDKLED